MTGSSRGIGRAVARALLQAQAQVALAVRDPAAVATWTQGHAGACALQVDLSDQGQCEGLIARAVERLGGLDVLVNCAGIVRYTPLSVLGRGELMAQLELNFIAPLLLARDAAVVMAAAGGGAIVNVASTLGLRPAPQTAAYAASKAALISLTKSLALEFGRDGVRANAVAPGVIDTDMVRVVRGPAATKPDAAEPAAIERQLQSLRELHLLRRLGTPDEVAQAVLYLIGAQYVTGSVLVVDGGLLLRE